MTQWQDTFFIPIVLANTELGQCRTLNFCDPEVFLSDDADADRYLERTSFKYFQSFKRVPGNQTTPYFTTSSKLGVLVMIKHEEEFPQNTNNSFTMMIHSPFEMPTKDNQQFFMVGRDFNRFSITPQLITIDETMIGMTPHE